MPHFTGPLTGPNTGEHMLEAATKAANTTSAAKKNKKSRDSANAAGDSANATQVAEQSHSIEPVTIVETALTEPIVEAELTSDDEPPADLIIEPVTTQPNAPAAPVKRATTARGMDPAKAGEAFAKYVGKDLDAAAWTARLLQVGIANQGHFAGVFIAETHGCGTVCSPSDLTAALAMAFPNANIGARHGPHYISHARKGRLEGLPQGMAPIPFTRKAKAPAAPGATGTPAVPKTKDTDPAALLAANSEATLRELGQALGVEGADKLELNDLAAAVSKAIG